MSARTSCGVNKKCNVCRNLELKKNDERVSFIALKVSVSLPVERATILLREDDANENDDDQKSMTGVYVA